MLDFIHLYHCPTEDNFNIDFIKGTQDYSIEELVIMAMQEVEAISNIRIEEVTTEYDMSKIDINEHKININFKKKNNTLEIPKYKYMADDVYAEMSFKIHIETNLHSKDIVKKILIPVKMDNFFIINNKRARAIWQLVEASVYTQRGRITLKSRMPIIVYKSKPRQITTIDQTESFMARPYLYAMDTRSKRRKSQVSKRSKNKFINPLMIFAAKVGLFDTIKFFGMKDVITLCQNSEVDTLDTERFLYFALDDLIIRVERKIFEEHDIVQSVVCMLSYLSSKDYPVEWDCLDDTEYWTSRIGYVGASKDKTLKTYYEKGKTAIYMIERLLDQMTIQNLRLPQCHKNDIYCILRWMIFEFDNLHIRDNTDVNNKRVRRNEYIVKSSLGRKISENINKVIPKLSDSRQNSMDTLLEIFNFGSNIILNGMRNLNDLIKPDDLVNDMTILQDLAYTTKGPEALGEDSTKNIMMKLRDLHPSFIGVIDPNCSSNSDVGMSGSSFVPYVKTYDRFYFTPEWEPSDIMYNMHNDIAEYEANMNPATEDNSEEHIMLPVKYEDKKDFEDYLTSLESDIGLEYAKIQIVERDTPPLPVQPEAITKSSMDVASKTS